MIFLIRWFHCPIFKRVNGRNLTINHGETLLLYALQRAHRGHIEFDLWKFYSILLLWVATTTDCSYVMAYLLSYSESKGGYCSYLLQSTFNVCQASSLSEPFFPHWPANSIKVRALNKILLSLSSVTHSASLPLMWWQAVDIKLPHCREIRVSLCTFSLSRYFRCLQCYLWAGNKNCKNFIKKFA